MLSESKYLEYALRREDADKSKVEVVQGEVPHVGLPVVVQGHRQHVQTDEHHDNHVELFVRHYPEYNCLRSPLKKKRIKTKNQNEKFLSL